MVSTRGPKFKFSDGEKVLCYEPDPTKAKVLYDSKILHVIVNKDQRGRKAVEYFIHFQGWNSSWDRSVTEEYVLKDTEENRELQRDLAQKTQLQLGAYLYRRERKKRSHKFSERPTKLGIEEKRRVRSSGSRATSGTAGSFEDGSSEQNEDYDTENIVTENNESSSEYEESTSADEDSGSHTGGLGHEVDIDIGNTLKRVLEQDHELINTKNKLAVLPAQPTVISILESWVLYYTNTQLNDMPDKRHKNSKALDILEKTITDINLCREIADGIRVYFDHTLAGLLLYVAERDQYNNMKVKATSVSVVHDETITIKDALIESDVTIKEEIDDPEFAHLPPFEEQEAETEKASAMTSTRRKLRSSRLSSAEEPKPSKSIKEIKQETENISSLNSLANTSSICSSPRGVTLRMSTPPINSAQVKELLEKASKWRLIKEDVDKTLMPSNTFGAIHLVRLFVRLPDLLQKTHISGENLKVVLKYTDMFVSFLEMHKEWFGEQFYMSKASYKELNTNR